MDAHYTVKSYFFSLCTCVEIRSWKRRMDGGVVEKINFLQGSLTKKI